MKYPDDLMIEILYQEEDIRSVAKKLADRINKDYDGKNLALVCTLKGAVPFFSELIKYIDIECTMEFIRASSYIGNSTSSNGNVEISNVMQIDVTEKDVLIVEDIVDTGTTCSKLIEYFKKKNCKSIEICSLLNKPSRRTCELTLKYVGYEVEDKFILGFGFDYNEKYRNIPYIGVMNPKYIV